MDRVPVNPAAVIPGSAISNAVISAATGDPALAARTLAQQAGVDDDIALNSIIAASVGQKDRRIYIGNLPSGAQPDIIKEFSKWGNYNIFSEAEF